MVYQLEFQHLYQVILTISGTASDDVGTYNYSLVVDNHLEQTSSAPYRATTVSEVITGSINILAGPAFTGSLVMLHMMQVQTLHLPIGAEGWAGFANENNTLYPISLTHGGKITFTGSAAQDTSVGSYLRMHLIQIILLITLLGMLQLRLLIRRRIV